MRRRLGMVAAAAVGLALVGCGSGNSDATPDEAGATTTAVAARPGAEVVDDAASVGSWCPVTTEQVGAVVHHDMVEGAPCAWSAPELSGAVLEVYVNGTDAAHLAGSTDVVAGLGDAAAFDVSDALVLEQDGSYWVVQILNIGGASDVVSRDAEIELAQLVLAGLA